MEDVKFSRLGDEMVEEGIDNGAAMSFVNHSYDTVVQSEVSFVNKADTSGLARMELLRQLRLYRPNSIRLLEFQVQAIANIVFRPSLININKVVRRKVFRGEDKTFNLREQVRFGSSDIGTTIVNDLLPGSGKTLMTMVSTIYFATHRAQEIKQRKEILFREQRPHNWSSRFGVYGTDRTYTNSIIVMASDKVVAQWETAAKQACSILNVKVEINRNPTACEDEVLSVDIFTSTSNLMKCFPHDDGFVPCVVVDEYVVKATHNIVTRCAHVTPLYGRLLLVSADAGDTGEIMTGARRTSLIRSTVGNDSDVLSLKNDVTLSASLMVCAVLPTQVRDEAHAFLIEKFNKTQVQKYTINYENPIWGYQGLELFGMNDMGSFDSFDELVDKIWTRKMEDFEPEVNVNFANMVQRVDEFRNEDNDCPVCLSKLKEQKNVCMLCNCWHFVCKQCTKQCLASSDLCPCCRENISGIVNVRVTREVKDLTKDSAKTFQKMLRSNLSENPTMIESCLAILTASASAMLEEVEGPTRILMMTPSKNFSQELQHGLKGRVQELVQVVQLKVGANKRKAAAMGYEEQLEWFRGEETEIIKVLCTHENVNNFNNDLYGLDFSQVDTICHVAGEFSFGSGISGRRLGRVSRVPRAMMKSNTTMRLIKLLPS